LIPFCAHVVVPLFDDVLSIIVLVVRYGTFFSFLPCLPGVQRNGAVFYFVVNV
jgi:hypothetical protein